MSFKVRNISNNTSFRTEKGEPVLTAALRNGHLYPYGCQAGACGSCKAKLVSGRVEHITRDPSVLSDDEVKQGLCLLCQAVPTQDIEIDIKEVARVKHIEIKTMPTRVREKTMLADDVVQLFLSVPKTHVFDFLPGQYLKILLKNGKERSFSIANTPQNMSDQGIELHIRIVPEGHYSPQVMNSLQVKDILRIQGPFGTYFLRKEKDRPIIMVAGGTGFAPIKGMIEDAFEAGVSQAITLYWGARTEADLYLNDLAEKWQQDRPNFNYVPVLSEQLDDPDWHGETGFVHEAIIRAHGSLGNTSVYASGPPVMIDALSNSLPDQGLDTEFFYTDAFDYAAASE